MKTFQEFITEAWIVRRDDDYVYVGTTYGEPVADKIRKAGGKWDSAKKFWKLKITGNETLIGELEQSTAAIKAAKAAEVPVSHPRSYEFRDFFRQLGGKWDSTKRQWKMPSQADADEVLKKIKDVIAKEKPTNSGPPINRPDEKTVKRISGMTRQAGQQSGPKEFHYMDDVFKPDSKYFESVYMSIIIRDKQGNYWKPLGVNAYFVSQQMADDFDIVGPDGSFSSHWAVTVYARPATNDESANERAKDAEEARKKASQAELEKFYYAVRDLRRQYKPLENKHREFKPEVTWVIATRPIYKSVVRGKIGNQIVYNYVDSFYDWPQDDLIPVPHVLPNEPPPTKVHVE